VLILTHTLSALVWCAS